MEAMFPIYVSTMSSERESDVTALTYAALSDAGISARSHATGSHTWGVVPAVRASQWDSAVSALRGAGFFFSEHDRRFCSPASAEFQRAYCPGSPPHRAISST